MASLKYHKDVKLWRVFWHVTLPDGTVDKGSKSFKSKSEGEKFKKYCEKNAKLLKRAITVEQVFLTDALDEWEAFCQGYTEQTRKLYISEVKKFIDFLPDNIVYISDLTKFHINSYLNSLMGRGLVNKTVNNSLCAIKSLCHFVNENYLIPNPSSGIKKLKEDPSEPHFLTMEEYIQIIKNSSEVARPWIRFIACTGLRATEFCNLKWKNCDIKNRAVTVIGKGRKKRTIGLNETAIEILKNMKAGRKAKDNDSVFVRKDRPLSRYILSWHIGKACCNSGLDGGGPHALRHFFATQLLLGGIPIIKVSALLGHNSIITTQRHYSHILSSDLSTVTDILKAV